MSSLLIDSPLLEGGEDGQGGHGDDECERVAASPCAPPTAGEADDAEGGRGDVAVDGSADPAPAWAGECGGRPGLVHRGRGKPSNRRILEKRKKKVLALYEERYGDFGPTLGVEKLAERDGITLSAETLRGWRMATGVTHFRRRSRPHRAWRAWKAHVGELVQLEGAHHDGLKGRGPCCVLMAYIDDASSRVFARFYEYEGTVPAMDSLGRDIKQYGILLAVYTDKHTTYKSPAQPTVDEQLAGEKPQSQFERSLAELGLS